MLTPAKRWFHSGSGVVVPLSRQNAGAGGRRAGGWRPILWGAAAVLSLVCGLVVWLAFRPAPRAPVPTKRTLARFPKDVRLARLVTSDDGARQASVQDSPDGGCRVVDTGTPQAGYRACGQRVFAFSRGPGRLFYDAIDESNRPWLVVDGVPLAIADLRGDGLAWSRVGGRRWAATGRAADRAGGDGQEVVVAVDGAVLGPWVDASQPAVSDDDAHVAVIVQHPDASLGLVVDGAEGRRYPSGATPCGMPPPPASDLGRHVQLRYLSDGRLVQVAPDRDGWGVYRDEERLATYPVPEPVAASGSESRAPAPECEGPAAVQVGSLNVAERAPVAVWWERLAGEPVGPDLRWRVSRDGEAASPVLCRWPSPAGDEIAITPDGRHVGFACAVGGAGPTSEVYAVLDGRRVGPYRQVWGVGISPDGEHLAYSAATGGSTTPWRVYRDGVPLSRSYRSIWPPRFSPDSRHVAWEALIDRDGRGVAGIDGAVVALFNGILAGPSFPAPDRVAWVMLRGRRVVRLELDLR